MGTVNERLNEKEYLRTNWINNDTALNADNMNNIEDGIEGLVNTLKDYQGNGDGSQVLNSEIVNGSVVKNAASAHASTAAGIGTVANKEAEFVVGKYNEESTDDGSLFVVGRGTNDANRENAFQVFSGKTIINNGLEINCDDEDGQKALQVNGNIELPDAEGNGTTIGSKGVQTTDVQAKTLEVTKLTLDENDGSITSPNANIGNANIGNLETDDLTVTNSATIKNATIVNSLTVNSDDENATPIIEATSEKVEVKKPTTFEDNINISSSKVINFGEGNTNINKESITTESVEVTKSFVATSTGNSDGDISTIKVEKTDDGKSKVILSGNVEVPTISDSSSDNAPVDKASFDDVKATVDKFFSGENQVDGVVDTLVEVQTLLEEYDETHNEIDISKANKFLSKNNIKIDTYSYNTSDNTFDNTIYTAQIDEINKDSLLVMDVNNEINISDGSFVIRIDGLDEHLYSLSKTTIESIGIQIDDNKYRLIFPNCLSEINIDSNGETYNLKDLWLSGHIDYVEHTMPTEDFNNSPFIMNAYFLCDLESAYKELDSIKANKFEGKDLADAFTEIEGKANKFKTGEGESAIDWDLINVYNKTLEIDDTIEETNEKVDELSGKVDECVSSVDNKANKIGSNEDIYISKDVDDNYIIKTTLDSNDRKLSIIFDAAVPEDFIYSDIRIDIKLDDTSCGINDPIANTNSYPYVFPDCIKSEETNLFNLWKKGAEVSIKMPKYVSQVDKDGKVVSYGTYSAEFVGRDLPDIYEEISGKLGGVKNQQITYGYYIYAISGTTLTLSTSRSEHIKPNASILSKWGEQGYFGKKWIDNQYVSYDAGIFYSLNSVVKSVDTENGTITLDKAPGTWGEANIKGATGTDYTIYLPCTPDAGEIPLFSNQLSQGTSVSVGNASVAINRESYALGPYSFAAGKKTTAGYGAAAFGEGSIAFANHSFVSGTNCNVEVDATNGHAEGHGTVVRGEAGHAEGHSTQANYNYSHAEGDGSIADNKIAHAEGESTSASGIGAHSEGKSTRAKAQASHSEGFNSETNGTYSHTEGYETKTGGPHSCQVGYASTFKSLNGTGENAHAEGKLTYAGGPNSHAEGRGSVTIGEGSHSEGQHCETVADFSHAEGYYTTVDEGAIYSHAEGYMTKVNATRSHSEGSGTKVLSGIAGHAEGNNTQVGGVDVVVGGKTYNPSTNKNDQGQYAHAEGSGSRAIRKLSHAEGENTTTLGIASHAEGCGTIAAAQNQHVQGRYNKIDADGNYAHIVGNGSSAIPANSHTIDWDGNAWFAGDIYIKGTVNGKDYSKAKKLATEEFVLANGGGGSGASIEVDDALSADVNATNPVQNKVVTTAINSINGRINTLNNDVNDINNNITTLTTEINDANESIVYIDERLEEIDELVTDVDIRLDNLNIKNGTGISCIMSGDITGYQALTSLRNDSSLSDEQKVALESMTPMISNGMYSFANGMSVYDENIKTVHQLAATGHASFAQGGGNRAQGESTHAQGYNTLAIGARSHTEGGNSITYAEYSHAEGIGTITGIEGESNPYHENYEENAGLRARAAHAEGVHTKALARGAHAEGYGTVATEQYQHVQGKFNYLDKNGSAGNYLHIVGNGSSDTSRSNAYTLDTQGNASFAGNVDANNISAVSEIRGRNLTISDTADIDNLIYRGVTCDVIELEITYEGQTDPVYIKVLGAEVQNG